MDAEFRVRLVSALVPRSKSQKETVGTLLVNVLHHRDRHHCRR